MPSSNAGPLLFVTSYTKFDNLAHSPRGTQAEHSVRTYGLDCGTGQLTLLSVNHEDTQKRCENFTFKMRSRCLHWIHPS